MSLKPRPLVETGVDRSSAFRVAQCAAPALLGRHRPRTRERNASRMIFARKVWHLLVGDQGRARAGVPAAVLLGALCGADRAARAPARCAKARCCSSSTARWSRNRSRSIRSQLLLSGAAPGRANTAARDLVRAIDAAARDERIKAVVLDLDDASPAAGRSTCEEIGEALDRVRAAKKPVLTYAIAYADDAMLLAAPCQRGVGRSAGRRDRSPGRAAAGCTTTALLDRLQGQGPRLPASAPTRARSSPISATTCRPRRARTPRRSTPRCGANGRPTWPRRGPRPRSTAVTERPGRAGSRRQAAISPRPRSTRGLVDQHRRRDRVRARASPQLVGEDDWDERPGAFASTDARRPGWPSKPGRRPAASAIGVITIAGEIVDGDAGPGRRAATGSPSCSTMRSTTISPRWSCGSIRPAARSLASEAIRRAILRHKAKGIPIVVSMGNLAASGGYWVSTPGRPDLRRARDDHRLDRHLRRGPDVRGRAGRLGRRPPTGCGPRRCRASPTCSAGFTPEVEAMLQATVEHGLPRFLGLRRPSRAAMTPERVDEHRPGPRVGRRHGAPDRAGRPVRRARRCARLGGRSRPSWATASGTPNTSANGEPLGHAAAPDADGRRSDDARARAGDMFALLAANASGRLLGRSPRTSSGLLGMRARRRAASNARAARATRPARCPRRAGSRSCAALAVR